MPSSVRPDGVAAAVALVAPARDEAQALELVDRPHEAARVKAHPAAELLLRGAVRERDGVQDGEVLGAQAERAHALREAGRLGPADEGQEVGRAGVRGGTGGDRGRHEPDCTR